MEGFCRPGHKEKDDFKDDALLFLYRDLCKCFSVTKTQLLGKDRTRMVATARAQLALRMSVELGFSNSEIAKKLAVSPTAVAKMIQRCKKSKKFGSTQQEVR